MRKPMHLHLKEGALHAQEGKPAGKKFSVAELEHLKATGTPLERKRANFALVAKTKWHHKGRRRPKPLAGPRG